MKGKKKRIVPLLYTEIDTTSKYLIVIIYNFLK